MHAFIEENNPAHATDTWHERYGLFSRRALSLILPHRKTRNHLLFCIKVNAQRSGTHDSIPRDVYTCYVTLAIWHVRDHSLVNVKRDNSK